MYAEHHVEGQLCVTDASFHPFACVYPPAAKICSSAGCIQVSKLPGRHEV